MNDPAPEFIHRFVRRSSARALLLLHGTGGDENDLLPFGRELDPDAGLLSVRGRVLENGMPRFFRRRAEGVFDEEDVIRRAQELADFIVQARENYALQDHKLLAVGYSNGANIASAMLFLRPGILDGAALLRAMVSFTPNESPNLQKAPILIVEGTHDPIVPRENAKRLAHLFEQAGADVRLEFEEAGHNLTAKTIALVRSWLAEIK
ncbi:MAG: alpha/beta hydrolase [Chthoniobacterales bacterium]